MSIAHSTRSCGLFCEGNRAGRAVRFQGGGTEERRGGSLPGQRRSEPNASEPDSASLRHTVVTTLPEMAKSVTGGEATSKSTRRATRGDWGGRVPKDRRGTWETRRGATAPVRGERCALGSGVAACGETGVSGSARAPHPEPSGWLQRRRGRHNPLGGRGRESERPIVAAKRGNARGAKGPHFSHVAIEERKPA